MPPKTAAANPKGPKAAAHATAAAPAIRVKKASEETDADTIPALAALPTVRTENPRRLRYSQRFKELTELILASDATYRLSLRHRAGSSDRPQQPAATRLSHSSDGGGGGSAPLVVLGDDYFPTLQVGFMARAMGLNLTEEQVVQLVRLVEDDAASRGTVSRRRLESVVVDALMTGVLGSPTLLASGAVLASQLPPDWQPSCCLRSDEATIFRAFAAIDTTGRGFLTADELRLALTSMGDPLSKEEMDEMLLAATEPGSDTVFYRDFADILARE